MTKEEVYSRIQVLKLREDKKYLHLKSLTNFTKHLYNYKEKDSKSNIKRLGVARKKEDIKEYLELIENKDGLITKEQSEVYFRKYIFKIGKFMSSSFNFSFLHIYSFLFWCVTPFLIGLSLEYFLKINIRLSILFLILGMSRLIFKIINGQVYGFKY